MNKTSFLFRKVVFHILIIISAPLLSQTANIEIEYEVVHPRCKGYQDGIISITNITGGQGEDFFISINGSEFTSDTYFDMLAEGEYLLLVKDAFLNSKSFLISLEVSEVFEIDITDDFDTYLGVTNTIRLEGANKPIQSHAWFPASSFSLFDDEYQFEVDLTDNITIYCRAEDIDGCIAEDQVTILVSKERNVYIPNIFSPNGDGENDYFKPIFGPSVDRIVSLSIYDRWGRLIWEGYDMPANSEDSGWDGQFNGRSASQGTYIYLTYIRFQSGREVKYEGSINLVR